MCKSRRSELERMLSFLGHDQALGAPGTSVERALENCKGGYRRKSPRSLPFDPFPLEQREQIDQRADEVYGVLGLKRPPRTA